LSEITIYGTFKEIIDWKLRKETFIKRITYLVAAGLSE